MILYIIFFFMGLALDYFYAVWTKAIVSGNPIAMLWAFIWAVINLVFVMKISEKQNWSLGIVYCLGVAAGTGIVLIQARMPM